MRFLVDAQLPPALARFLEEQGHEARAVREVGLREADDAAVCAVAERDRWRTAPSARSTAAPRRKSSGSASANSTKRVLLAWFARLLPDVLRELAAGHRIVEVRR